MKNLWYLEGYCGVARAEPGVMISAPDVASRTLFKELVITGL